MIRRGGRGENRRAGGGEPRQKRGGEGMGTAENKSGRAGGAGGRVARTRRVARTWPGVKRNERGGAVRDAQKQGCRHEGYSAGHSQ